MLGLGLALAAQEAPRSEGPASRIVPPGLPPVTGSVGAAPGGIHGGLTDEVIRWIINSAPVVRPRIATPQRVRVSQGVSAGLLLKKVNPEYPEEARRGRIQGTVVLHVLISKAGDIARIEVVSGDPLLAPEAIRVVKLWRYRPYLLNGNPVEVDTQILINFTLSGS
jgi:periplasmic protein TonB